MYPRLTSESVRLEQEELYTRRVCVCVCVCVDSTLRPAAVLLPPGESPEQEELDIRTLHLLRATVHNEERKLPENWEENPAEHKKYSIPFSAGDSTFGKK